MPWKRPRCIDTSVGYCGVLEEGRAPSGLRECVRQGVFVVEVIITLPLAAKKGGTASLPTKGGSIGLEKEAENSAHLRVRLGPIPQFSEQNFRPTTLHDIRSVFFSLFVATY